MEDETKDGLDSIQPVDLSKEEAPVDTAFEEAFELNRIFHELPPELIASLDKTLAKEEHDDLAQALIEDVDAWGRQEIDKLKAETNNKVRTYLAMEGTDVQEARRRCREDKKRLKTEAKKSMKAIQDRLSGVLETLTADLDTDIEVLRTKYKDMYARSEACLKRDTDQIIERVASLMGPLQKMSTEQLLGLKQSAAPSEVDKPIDG